MINDFIQRIRNCFETNRVLYSKHSRFEMQHEEFGRIFEHEVYEAILNGEVIEEYPEDKPYPSVLISGATETNRPLHIVCAYNEAENFSYIVTVYHPNPILWKNFKTRIKL